MQAKAISALFWAATAFACTIPPVTLSATITQPFQIQVQNASQPAVHNKFMNLLQADSGDQHLYIGPVGTPAFNLTLVDGVITRGVLDAVSNRGILHAAINGEVSDVDSTTEISMTDRGDPWAVFAPTYACNPDTDALQVELRFVGRQTSPEGGWICVRPSDNGSYEFRYYPPGNTKVDPNRTCIKVTLVVLSQGSALSSSAPPPNGSTSSAPNGGSSTSVAASSTTLTTSTTAASSATTSGTPLPYTDLTAVGFRFVGCAPEERTMSPPDGCFRTLPVLYTSDALTGQMCVAYCQSKGYVYAGMEYRRECWCGNSYAAARQPKTTLASLAACSQKCAGDSSEFCGGSDWLSLYAACAAGGPCVNAKFT